MENIFDSRHFFAEFKQKRICALIDDLSSTGSQSVFAAPAEDISPEKINTLLFLTGGIFFVALGPERASQFALSPISRAVTTHGSKVNIPSFNILTSVEAREGVTTGISAFDRAVTVSVLGEKVPNPRRIISPGHVFPVLTRQGGVLVKNALPEGALDVVKAAGFTDAALFIDIVNPQGAFCSKEEVLRICSEQRIPYITLSELINFRLEHESLVTLVAETKLPTVSAGEMKAYIFTTEFNHTEHVALVKGDIAENPDEPVLTRVQPEMVLTDVFGGSGKPSRYHIRYSLQEIGRKGRGVFLYLRNAKSEYVKGYLEKAGADTASKEQSPVLMREYGLGAQILRKLGVRKISMLTSTPSNVYTHSAGLKIFGIEIATQILIPSSEEHHGSTR